MKELFATVLLIYVPVIGFTKSVDVQHVSGMKFEVSCNTIYGGYNYKNGDHVAFTQRVVNTRFRDDVWTQTFLQEVAAAVESACKGRSKTGRVSIRVDPRGTSWFEAMCVAGEPCRVTRNGAKVEAAAQEMQLKENQARATRQRELETARVAEKNAADARAQSLSDRYRAEWIQWDKVRANPFAFQDKVYLVNTEFDRMLTADTAVFGAPLATKVIVTAVPRAAFTEPKPVVLVGQVLDSDPSRNPPGVSGTHIRLKYISHEFCARRDCSDFGSIRR